MKKFHNLGAWASPENISHLMHKVLIKKACKIFCVFGCISEFT